MTCQKAARKTITYDYLYEQYITLGRSAKDMAKELGYAFTPAFHRFRRRLGVPDKNQKPKTTIPKEALHQLYVVERKSAEVICRELSIKSTATVYRLLRKHGIEVRGQHEKPYRRREKHGRWNGCGELSGTYWNSVKYAAAERGMTIEITIEEAWGLFVKQNRRCAMTGVELGFPDLITNSRYSQTASLDRIDSTRGYTTDNCQWVHKDINAMKWDFSLEEFVRWCELVTRHHKTKRRRFTNVHAAS